MTPSATKPSAAHRGERETPSEGRTQREAHDGRDDVAEVAADPVRAVRVAEPPRLDVGVEDREIGWMEDTVADAHQRGDGKEPSDPGREAREHRSAGQQRETGQQNGARSDAIDDESRGELREAARRVEHADQRCRGPRS